MPRYYVEKNGEWNIFSTIVDDFILDEFVCLDALKARLLYERYKELTEDIDSLLTDNPRVNVMTYSEAIERKQADTPQTNLVEDSPSLVKDLVKDTPQTEICDTCKYRSSNVFGNWCVGRDTCDRYEADTPQTEMDKCYKCKWWNYSYGCSNKKGICDFEQADTPQNERSE